MEDTARLARIAQLKTQFDAGTLQVDPIALATKLLEAHLSVSPSDIPPPESSACDNPGQGQPDR